MTGGAGPYRNGSVLVFLLERGAVVTSQAELGLVLADLEKEAACGTVRLVTREAVTVLHRGVHHLLFPHGIVALGAELGHLGRQLEALPSLDGVLLGFLHMADEAVAVLDRLVKVFQAADSGVTGCGNARVGKG
jgi:hypothetical protein